MSKIAVIGAGYVGLTTAACFSALGHDVVCADLFEEKVARLNRGEIPILEAGLEQIVREGLDSGHLRFVVGAEVAAADCEFAYLCVETPQSDDGSADLRYIQAAARQIAPVLPSESVVVNKSTVPVGSTRVVERALQRDDISVVSNPEFLREGSAVHDFMNPDRIVIGADDQSAAIKVASLYLGVTAPLVVTDPASAETIKYAANSFLATKISFINAVAAICEAVGADINDVALGIGYDKRIGSDFLKPGPGFGGSCFPKDTRAMVKIAEEVGYDFHLLRGVIQVNEEQYERTARKAVELAGGSVDGLQVAAWGLTFKARTDDLRESPSLEVLGRLAAQGAKIRAYDPAVSGQLPERFAINGLEVVGDPYDACDGAEVLLVLTEWDEFKWLDLDQVQHRLANKAVVDARNLLDRSALVRRGFAYRGIGRN